MPLLAGTWRLRWLLLLASLLVLLFTSLLMLLIREEHRQLFAEEQGARLQAVLAITSDSLHAWQARQQRLARMLAADPQLLANAALLPTAAVAAQDGPVQQQIRQRLGQSLMTLGFSGFQLLDGQGRVLASHDPFAQGALSRVVVEQGAVEQALAGDVVVTPPLLRPLASTSSGEPSRLGKPVIMTLVLLPGTASQPQLLALLSEPDGEFATIFNRARRALSDETYAVDRNGVMLTESRFSERLWMARLLPVGHSSALKLRVAAPRHDHGQQTLPVAGAISELPLTKAAEQVVAGSQGGDLDGYVDYRGSTVIGAWQWDSQLGYGLITEIDEAEAYALAWRASRFTLLWFASFVVVLLLLVMSWWLASRRRQRDNQLLRQLLAAAPTAIAFTDSQGRYQLVNERFAQRLGMTVQALQGGLPEALLPLDEVRLLRELVRQARSSGEAVTVCQPLNGQRLRLTVFALSAETGGDGGYCTLIREADEDAASPPASLPQPAEQPSPAVGSARLLGRLGETLGQAVAAITSLEKVSAGELLPLRTLATDLLELSLAESGQLQLDLQLLDWPALVDQACNRHGLALSAPLAQPAQVIGEPLRLSQLLDHVLLAMGQLAVASTPMLAWQLAARDDGRPCIHLELALATEFQPALYQWLGYVPGPLPFDGCSCADLKLRLGAHWLKLMDGELALLSAGEQQPWSGLRVTLLLAPSAAEPA